MSAGDSNTKWTAVDQGALANMTNLTSSPGVVFPIGSNVMPMNIQSIPGAVSYFASAYTAPMAMSNLTAGAEIAMLRTDDEKIKGYCWVVATNSNGQVLFNGPHYHSTAHHFPAMGPVPVESLFGHADKITKDKP